MFQHVAHDEWQILLRYNLFLVAQFGNTLGYTFGLLRCELQTEFFQILGDVSFTAILTKGIFALSTESLWHQSVAIQVILLVAIGMHTSHLGKHVIADDRLIRCYGNTTIALNHTRDVVQLVLADISAGIKLVLQNYLHTRQRCITTTLTQSVHRYVQTFGATQHSSQRIGYCQIVIVMGMEVEVRIGITLQHFAEVLDTLQRVHDTQGIGQHKASDTHIAQRIHQLVNVGGRLVHTVAPILQIQVNGNAFFVGITHLAMDILYVLVGCFLQLLGTMLQRAFGQQIHGFTTALSSPVDAFAAIDKAQHLYPFESIDT